MDGIKQGLNLLISPQATFLALLLLLGAGIRARRALGPKQIAVIAVLSASVFAWALADEHFRQIVTAPDNVAIVLALALMGFFTWLSIWQGTQNDRRIAKGRPTHEGEEADRDVWSWPDLVYVELIALILCTSILYVWAILVKAPIEQPANQASTPNPCKAPWYFVGLQEMLIYFDPWLAGVVYPCLIVGGLALLPYFDVNPKGNGYFTFAERRISITIFLFGLLGLWMYFIAVGTFLRGPNWSSFGPFEAWDPFRREIPASATLSELFWSGILSRHAPKGILLRESPGLVALVGYFGVMPWILGRTALRRIRAALGMSRYVVATQLLLWMGLLPLKMVLRWTIGLKYIVAMAEYSLNV